MLKWILKNSQKIRKSTERDHNLFRLENPLGAHAVLIRS